MLTIQSSVSTKKSVISIEGYMMLVRFLPTIDVLEGGMIIIGVRSR